MPFFERANQFTINGGEMNDIARDMNVTNNNNNTTVTNSHNTHAETTIDSHHNSSRKFCNRGQGDLTSGQCLPEDPATTFNPNHGPVGYAPFHRTEASPLIGFSSHNIVIDDRLSDAGEFLSAPQAEFGDDITVETTEGPVV